jgi:hypothetical protein
VKNLVHQVINNDLQQLKALNAAVTHKMLKNTWTDFGYLLDICRANKETPY